MENNTFDTIVIGGGITALTAAYALNKLNKRILIIEPDQLGGALQTKRVDGFQCEQGPSVFVKKGRVLPFLDDLGLSGDIIEPSAPRSGKYIWCNDKVCKVPTDPLSFFLTPLIPDFDKMMLLRVLKALFSNKVLRPQVDDESVAQFCSKIFGRRTIERLIDAALKGIYGGDVDLLSARSLFPGLWQALLDGKDLRGYFKIRAASPRGGIFVLKHGAQSIIEALKIKIDKVDIVKAKAETVSYSEGEFSVLAGGATYKTKELFIATSGKATAPFLKKLNPHLSQSLSKLNYTALAVVHCGVSSDITLKKNAFGVLFPKGIPDSLLGVMYNSELFPQKAPQGQHLLTLCFGGASKQEVVSADVEYWEKAALTALSDKLAIDTARVLCVTKHLYAIPQFEVGHFKLVSEMRKCEDTFKGLHFIGADCGGIAVPDRITEALNTVDNL